MGNPLSPSVPAHELAQGLLSLALGFSSPAINKYWTFPGSAVNFRAIPLAVPEGLWPLFAQQGLVGPHPRGA